MQTPRSFPPMRNPLSRVGLHLSWAPKGLTVAILEGLPRSKRGDCHGVRNGTTTEDVDLGRRDIARSVADRERQWSAIALLDIVVLSSLPKYVPLCSIYQRHYLSSWHSPPLTLPIWTPNYIA